MNIILVRIIMGGIAWLIFTSVVAVYYDIYGIGWPTNKIDAVRFWIGFSIPVGLAVMVAMA